MDETPLPAGRGGLVSLRSREGPWDPTVERLPRLRVDGRWIQVRNLRCIVGAEAAEPPGIQWYARRFPLDGVRRMSYNLHRFSRLPGLAHAFVSFETAPGEWLAVSAEIRRRRGQPYNPVLGCLEWYPLCIVAGDERDLIGRRLAAPGQVVRVFPVRASPEIIQRLLLALLERADRLAHSPEAYHTVRNNCLTTILHPLAAEFPGWPRRHWRLWLPDFSDALALRLGALEAAPPIRQARRQFGVESAGRPAPFPDDAAGFSRAIRRHWPRP